MPPTMKLLNNKGMLDTVAGGQATNAETNALGSKSHSRSSGGNEGEELGLLGRHNVNYEVEGAEQAANMRNQMRMDPKADADASAYGLENNGNQQGGQAALQNVIRDSMSLEPRREKESADTCKKDAKCCIFPENYGKQGCRCDVEEYFACKTQGPECRDQYGVCDPASTTMGTVIKAATSWQSWIAWYTKKPTCITQINPINGMAECKQSFVADFKYNGHVVVCYEQSVSAPARWSSKKGWQNYTKNLLDGMRAEFPFMYEHSRMLDESCADLGFRWDRKVHPCSRHAYISFRDEESQLAYRQYRQEMINKRNPKQKEWNERFPAGTLLHDDTTERVYSGHCNNGL